MTPYFNENGITIFHGDCREILPALSPVNVAITDPPYSEHVHAKNRRGLGANSGAIAGARNGFADVRALRPDGHSRARSCRRDGDGEAGAG